MDEAGGPATHPVDEPSIDLLDAAGFEPLVASAATIYGAAMRRSAATVASRRDLIRTHLDRSGFTAVTASRQASLLGFGYGYLGGPGQWWHDVVARGLGRQEANVWLADAFELAELHVDPPYQGQGLGRQLIGLLLHHAPGAAVLLSTPDENTPARRLYRSLGFVDLLVGFHFPGSGEPYAVMGLRR